MFSHSRLCDSWTALDVPVPSGERASAGSTFAS
jgi:hypothetical protein